VVDEEIFEEVYSHFSSMLVKARKKESIEVSEIEGTILTAKEKERIFEVSIEAEIGASQGTGTVDMELFIPYADSMYFANHDSGTTFASIVIPSYQKEVMITAELHGEVRIYHHEEGEDGEGTDTRYDGGNIPEQVLNLIYRGADLNTHGYTVDMNNWFEIYLSERKSAEDEWQAIDGLDTLSNLPETPKELVLILIKAWEKHIR
jgi:hypothetical protein